MNRSRPLNMALWAAVLLSTLTIARTEQAVLLKGGKVHTVSGEDLAPGDILIRGSRIAAVGSELDPGGATVVDISGKHVYPGLIAVTSSLGLSEINAVRSTIDTSEVGEFTPDVQAWIAVNPDSELLPVARANGITHALVLPMGGIVSGHSGLMALEGWTVEDRLVKAPAALHLFWPGMNLDTTPREQYRDKSRWISVEDQAKNRRKKLKEIDDFFAEARAYAKARVAGNGSAIAPAWEAMFPVLRGDVPVIVHADDIRQIKAAVEFATAHGLKIAVAGGRDAWRVADLLATNEVPVIFERLFDLPGRQHDSYDVHFKAPEALRKAGVRVMFSEGAGPQAATQVRNLPYAAAQAVAFGFPPKEALKALTLYPAELLNVADRLGAIEPEKEATLFVSDKEIFDIRGRVERMWIRGVEVSLENRQTRLYDRYRQRPRVTADD